jgi:translocation and assembly module TamB
VEVEGERLVWAGRTRAEGVRARAEGTLAAHTLALDGRIDGYPVKGTAEGAWRDARWSGTLGTLEVAGEYPFALDGAMPLTASRELVEAGPGRALFAGGRLELDSVRWQDERLASRGRFAALPALPFLRAAGASVHPKSDLRLVGQWDVRASPKLDGTVSIARESGDLVLPTDPAVAAGLRTLAIDAKLAADAIDAVARIDSRIGTGTATVATSGIARTSALKAGATLQVPTLKPFEALVGTTALVDGRVDLALAAGGTLGQPVVTGTLAGRDMRVDSPLYGIALRDGELRATLADSVLKLEQFTARGDRGRFVAEGAMPLRGGDPEARLTWRAEDLSLFSRPDRRLQVDGTGTLNLERGRLALRGALKADSAYFEFERPAVAQLDDDIVVRGRPRERRAEAFRSALLDLDLELDFGDDFRILGAGLESTLRGRMRVRTAPDGTLVAKGTVTSERGTYYAFGQKLTIDRGALIFDGPIDNPSLDVLALRKGLQVEAGVELTGTVRVPRLRLVSQPPVSDAEKLSWLTLGSGPEAMTGANLALVQAAASAVLQGGSQLPLGRRVAQSVGLDDITFRGSGAAGSQVVAIGKRLSDRVYVEYEQGVVATNFIVRLSYALSRFISASAETGRATGVGVYYRRSFE